MEGLIDKIIDLKENMDRKTGEIRELEHIHRQLLLEKKRLTSERERLLQDVSSLFIESSDAVLTELPDRSIIDRIIVIKNVLDSHAKELRDYEKELVTLRTQYTRMENTRESYIVELCDLLKESPPKEPINLSAAFKFMDKKTNLTEPHVEEAERMHLERRRHTIREALSPNVQSKSDAQYNALMKRFEKGGKRRTRKYSVSI